MKTFNAILNKTNNLRYVGILLLIHGLFPAASQAQEALTLSYCYDKAIASSPLKKQKLYYESILELNRKSHASLNYPVLGLNAQASYQSDVFSLPFALPGFDTPLIPQEQYKVAIDFYQNIYNGGVVKNKQAVEEANARINLQGVEISNYKIREVVNRLYFSALILQKQSALIEATQNDIQAQYNLLQARVEAGAALPGSAKTLRKELLTLDQKRIELNVSIQANLDMLSLWIEEPIGPELKLELPELERAPDLQTHTLTRPELTQFDMQVDRLASEKALIQTGRIPDIDIFGTAGMGYPNPFNWFDVNFSPYYLVGIKLSWKILDYGAAKRNKEVLQLNQLIVVSEKENFIKTVEVAITSDEANIRKYSELIAKDLEIILLQEDIVKQAASQMQHGVIPGATYITEVNKELQAKLNLKIHEIKLAEARINLLTETGNINEL